MSEAELRGGAPAPTDLGKSLRCCGVCRLVKTFEQFYDAGCENCVFLDMEGDRERVFDCTTTEFKARAGGPASGESGARRLCLPPPPTHTLPTHTPRTQGMVAVIDPATSWSAKWQHLRKSAPGCYALSVEVGAQGRVRRCPPAPPPPHSPPSPCRTRASSRPARLADRPAAAH